VVQLRRLTLTDSRVAYVAGVLAILGTICAIVIFFPYGVYNLKCQRFDLPELEKAFGFRLGEVEGNRPDGGTYTALGITALEPNGRLAVAGFRPGDVPRTHHGLAEFCGDLGAAREGRTVQIRVYNVYDARAGADPVREVNLSTRRP
jgi:hypothetical protein